MKKEPEIVVGVRELRARLSAHLRAVACGHTVTIGDRQRRPVARIVPIERSSDEEILDRLAARGVIQRGSGKPAMRERIALNRGARPTSDLVIEDRR